MEHCALSIVPTDHCLPEQRALFTSRTDLICSDHEGSDGIVWTKDGWRHQASRTTATRFFVPLTFQVLWLPLSGVLAVL